MFKRSFSLLLSLVVLGSLFFSAPSYAAEPYRTAKNPEEFKRIIVTAMKNHESALRILYTGSEQLVGPNDPMKMIGNELRFKPENNYINRNTTYGYDMSYDDNIDHYIYNFRFEYFLTKEEQAFVDRQSDTIIKEIIKPGMTTEEKVRAINQYVVDHVEYDDATYEGTNVTLHSYSAYGALHGLAVCEGYTSIMQTLFDKAGIPSYIITGTVYGPNGEGHAWNLVNVDGVWRYVDATWNDGQDFTWDDDYRYINATVNFLIRDGRVWDWQDYPLTPDSPAAEIVDRSQEDKLSVEAVRKNDRTYLIMYGVNEMDDIVVYDENKEPRAQARVYPDYIQNIDGENVFELDLTMELSYSHEFEGKFYVTHASEHRQESDPVFVEYDFRADSKPISPSQIAFEGDYMYINGSFGYSGDLYIYDSTGKLVFTESIAENEDTMLIPLAGLPSKGTVSISAQRYFGKESPKTVIALPDAKQSKPSNRPEVDVYLDGERLAFDVPARTMGGYTMVPLRKIFEELGATVEWDDKTRTVTATKGDTRLTYTVGEKHAFKNNQKIALAAPGVIRNGSTLVPLRFVSESLGNEVYWEPYTRTVYISSSN